MKNTLVGRVACWIMLPGYNGIEIKHQKGLVFNLPEFNARTLQMSAKFIQEIRPYKGVLTTIIA